MSKIKGGMKSLFTIAKNAAIGVDQSVPEAVKEERRAICSACPKLKTTGQCGECFCFIKAKSLIRQEKCPLDKWSSWEDNQSRYQRA